MIVNVTLTSNNIVDSAALTQTAGSPDAVIQHVSRELVALLDLRDCRYEYGMLLGHPARLEPDGRVLTRHGFYPVDEAGLPKDELELRTFSNGLYRDRFMMFPHPGAHPSQRARLVAVAVADMAGHSVGAATSAAP